AGPGRRAACSVAARAAAAHRRTAATGRARAGRSAPASDHSTGSACVGPSGATSHARAASFPPAPNGAARRATAGTTRSAPGTTRSAGAAPGVLHSIQARLVAHRQRDRGAGPGLRGHAVPVAVLETRPVEAPHVPGAQLAAHAANVGLEVVRRRLAVVERAVADSVLAAGAHRSAPFRAHGTIGVAPDLTLELARPLGLAGPSVGTKEAVVVHAQKAAVERAGSADVGDVLGVAGPVEDDPAPRNGRKLREPAGVQRDEVGRAVHVRFVEDFEVGIAVAAVLVDHRLPHVPK